MIIVGIDDTDTIDTRGTNQLAREIVRRAARHWTCQRIVRHQLLFDDRIPYTSHNGSASICLRPVEDARIEDLTELCRRTMWDWYIAGSDPGLCIAASVSPGIVEFGQRCQREIVNQIQSRRLASDHGVYLEGLGGTEGGVIGALVAVGLAASANDGRIIQWKDWPDDLSGVQSVAALHRRDVRVCVIDRGIEIETGHVDVGKHLRPNLRQGNAVLFVRQSMTDGADAGYAAVKVP